MPNSFNCSNFRGHLCDLKASHCASGRNCKSKSFVWHWKSQLVMEVWLTEREVNTDIFLIFIIYIIKGFLLLLACDKYFLLDSYCNKDTVWRNLHVFMGEQLSTVANKTQTPLPMNRKCFCAMFEALWLSTSMGTCACKLCLLFPRWQRCDICMLAIKLHPLLFVSFSSSKPSREASGASSR